MGVIIETCPHCDTVLTGIGLASNYCQVCGQDTTFIIGPNLNSSLIESDVVPTDFIFDQKCPNCEEPFDNWDCKKCGFSRSSKSRKAHGQQLTPKDTANIRKQLGLE